MTIFRAGDRCERGQKRSGVTSLKNHHRSPGWLPLFFRIGVSRADFKAKERLEADEQLLMPTA